MRARLQRATHQTCHRTSRSRSSCSRAFPPRGCISAKRDATPTADALSECPAVVLELCNRLINRSRRPLRPSMCVNRSNAPNAPPDALEGSWRSPFPPPPSSSLTPRLSVRPLRRAAGALSDHQTAPRSLPSPCKTRETGAEAPPSPLVCRPSGRRRSDPTPDLPLRPENAAVLARSALGRRPPQRAAMVARSPLPESSAVRR